MNANEKAPVERPAPWPVFDEEMVEAASEVLRSGKVNYWTGEHGRRFEEEFAEFCGCRHAVAVANGTLALELALHALGVGPEDEVIVPCRTFIASASAVAARGATPVMADVDRESGVLTAETILREISPRTRAVVAVHLAGWPCDIDAISEVCRSRSISIVEDCAQAHGAQLRGRPVGSLGDVAAFSFCQDKILTTGGEGGMLTTNRRDLWDLAWRYKDHGKTPDTMYNPQPPGPTFRWLHESFGSNYRLTEMQSAIGRLALKRLPAWGAARRTNAAQLAAACLETPGLRTPTVAPDSLHAYYKFYAYVEPEMLAHGWSRDLIVKEIRSRGVPCLSGSCSEIYREKAFAGIRPITPKPVASELGETSLMLLVHPTLEQRHLTAACDAIKTVMAQATSSAAGREVA